MDIARYIGLFLLKNEQCYVNGLGTLQFIRKPATYDGQHLHASTNEINIVPGGNVDESLANFIATNEQISITKAVNALKEYSTETKNRLQAGQMVTLPYLGKLMAEDGRIGFITDPLLQFSAPDIAAKKGLSLQHNERPPIPHQPFIPSSVPQGTKRSMPVADGTSVPPAMPQGQPIQQQYEEEGSRVNWARIIFVILLMIILACAAYYGYMRYMAPKAKKQATVPTLTIPDEIEEEPVTEDATMAMDSAAGMMADTAAATPVQPEQKPAQQEVTPPPAPAEKQPKPVATETKEAAPAPATQSKKTLNLKIVVNTFDSKTAAYNRKNQLAASGTKADVIEEDVNYYFVVIPVKTDPADTAKLIQDMTNKYNKEGVFIY